MNASRPPAEAPMQTIGNSRFAGTLAEDLGLLFRLDFLEGMPFSLTVRFLPTTLLTYASKIKSQLQGKSPCPAFFSSLQFHFAGNDIPVRSR